MEGWTEEELQIFRLFNFRCIMDCGRKAVTLHEIVPKSLRPKDWNAPENRVPVCNECHNMIHHNGTRKYRTQLQELRQKRIKNVNI